MSMNYITIEDNDGDVLFLSKQNVKCIKRVEETDTDASFEIQFNDSSSTYISFYFQNYNMEKDQLVGRVKLMRSELIKNINDGKEPDIMFKEINLKKSE